MDNMFSNWEDIAELELFMDDFVEETVDANYSNTVAMSNHQGLNHLNFLPYLPSIRIRLTLSSL
jgi:hypothetical protein